MASPLPPAPPVGLRKAFVLLIHHFVASLIYWFVDSHLRWFLAALSRSFVDSLIRSFIDAWTRCLTTGCLGVIWVSLGLILVILGFILVTLGPSLVTCCCRTELSNTCAVAWWHMVAQERSWLRPGALARVAAALNDHQMPPHSETCARVAEFSPSTVGPSSSPWGSLWWSKILGGHDPDCQVDLALKLRIWGTSPRGYPAPIYIYIYIYTCFLGDFSFLFVVFWSVVFLDVWSLKVWVFVDVWIVKSWHVFAFWW